MAAQTEPNDPTTDPKEPAATAAEPDAGAKEPAAEPNEPDYKALYEEAKAESRKWERRAKSGDKRVAGAQKSAEERIQALEDELARSKAEKDRMALVSKVSAATGVPANLIQGDDEEAMTSFAAAIGAYAKSVSTVAPLDKGGAAGGSKPTRESILQIADARERRRAIAENIDLFR